MCEEMDFLGIRLNQAKNESRSDGLRVISSDESPVKVLVIPTNEELEIAQQAYDLVNP